MDYENLGGFLIARWRQEQIWKKNHYAKLRAIFLAIRQLRINEIFMEIVASGSLLTPPLTPKNDDLIEQLLQEYETAISTLLDQSGPAGSPESVLAMERYSRIKGQIEAEYEKQALAMALQARHHIVTELPLEEALKVIEVTHEDIPKMKQQIASMLQEVAAEVQQFMEWKRTFNQS